VKFFHILGESRESGLFNCDYETSPNTWTCCVALASHGRTTVAGDLNCSIIKFDNESYRTRGDVIRDASQLAVTEVAIIDDHVLVADDSGCLTVMDYGDNSISKTGTIQLPGEIVNRILPVSRDKYWNPIKGPNASSVVELSAYIGTSTGAIYGFGFVNPKYASLLQDVQNNLKQMAPGIPGYVDALSYQEKNGPENSPVGIIDGEVVSQFLNLSPSQKKYLVQGGESGGNVDDATVDEITSIIENLRRIV
jgi:hypothetical protein